MKYYYTNAANEAKGPAELAEIRAMVARQEIPADCRVVAVGDTVWKPLASLPVEGAAEAAPSAAPSAPAATPAPSAAGASGAGSWERWVARPAELVERTLASAKRLLSAERVEQVSRLATVAGHQALLVTALLGLLVSLVAAARASMPGLALVGVVLVVVLAVAQFMAKRFLQACAALLRATGTRTSTTSIYDVFGIVFALAAIATFLVLAGQAFSEGGVALLSLPADLVILLIGLALAAGSFHPRALSISPAENSSAGEEAVSILSYLLKLPLYVMPIVFGAFAITGALLQVAALFLVLFKFDELDTLSQFVPVPSLGFAASVVGGGAIVLVAAITPFIAYLNFLLCYLGLDLIRAVVSVPAKLDALRRNT